MEKGPNRVPCLMQKVKVLEYVTQSVRETKQGFLVFDVKTHKRIGEFFQ